MPAMPPYPVPPARECVRCGTLRAMRLSQRPSVPRVLWFAMLTSVGMYGVVLFVLRDQPHAPLVPMMMPMLAATAGAVAVGSFVVPSILKRGLLARIELPAFSKPLATPMSADTFRDAASSGRTFDDPVGAVRLAFRIHQTPFIVSLALSEAVAIFGFVAGFLGAPLAQFVPIMLAGAVLMAVRFPTRAAVLGPLERRAGVRFAA